MLVLKFLFLFLIYVQKIYVVRIGMIENVSLASSFSIFAINRTDCQSCICDLFSNSFNISLGALNCWKNRPNEVFCQYFTLFNNSNITTNTFSINLNSSFFFRSEFSWKTNSTSFSYASTGILVAGDGTEGSSNQQLDHPSCIYIDKNDDLYICDTNNHRIQKWTKNGSIVTTVAGGTQGIGANQLNEPLALTFDQFGFLYVVDSGNCRVQRFAPNSTTGVTVAGDNAGLCGSSTSRLDRPTGIAIDWNLNLFIADFSNRRILQFSPNNNSNGVSITGRLSGRPYGVALRNRSSDFIYFIDNQKKEWNVWPNGASSPSATIDKSNDFDSPTFIVVDDDTNVFIVDETEEKVFWFSDLSSNSKIVLDNPNPIQTTTGIAFDSGKNLYLTSETPSGVYKFVRL